MLPRRLPLASVALAAVLVFAISASCGDSPAPLAPSPSPQPNPQPPPAVITGVLVGAGDIAMCGRPAVEATATLLDGIPGTVFAAGDNAYPVGSAQDYAMCYEPTWGRHKQRTRPAPGNHEYMTPQAAGYFGYFGESAGPAGVGYYSYSEGAWLVLSLNSNIAANAGSAQAAWVRATLAANPAPCTLAYWHHPVFSSGRNGSFGIMRDVWRILHEAGADVIVAAHDHLYERFAPQDADGRHDPQRGLRQFTVGTGGADLYEFRSILPNSESRGIQHGVLKLNLRVDGYDWQFVPIAGGQFSDSGSAQCH